MQKSTNQNYNQHQQPICSSTFFFYINNKSRPTSTIHVQINIRNMPNSTTKESQHQQIPRFFNDHVPQKQHRTSTSTKRKTRSTIWGQTTSYGRGWLGPAAETWRLELRTKCRVSGGTFFYRFGTVSLRL